MKKMFLFTIVCITLYGCAKPDDRHPIEGHYKHFALIFLEHQYLKNDELVFSSVRQYNGTLIISIDVPLSPIPNLSFETELITLKCDKATGYWADAEFEHFRIDNEYLIDIKPVEFEVNDRYNKYKVKIRGKHIFSYGGTGYCGSYSFTKDPYFPFKTIRLYLVGTVTDADSNESEIVLRLDI